MRRNYADARPRETSDLKQAVRLYRTFHQLEPRKVGYFARGFEIPREVYHVGEATQVLYRSDKLNPVTGKDEGIIDYFHDHEGNVRMCLCEPLLKKRPDAEYEVRALPSWIWDRDALTALGLVCLGFHYRDFDGRLVKTKSTRRFPELYTIPSGKALLVIQDKRSVLAVMYGGRLAVQWRGIVG